MLGRLVAASIIFVSLFAPPARAVDAKTFGIIVGGSFPKVVYGKAQLNFTNSWSIDVQTSLGISWSILQADMLHFFYRGEDFHFFTGIGYEVWTFYGLTGTGSVNGVYIVESSRATAISIPLGIQFLSDGGLAMELAMGLGVFTSGPSGVVGKVVPQIQVGVGLFF